MTKFCGFKSPGIDVTTYEDLKCNESCALYDQDRKQCCFMTIAKVLVNRGL